MAIPQVYTFPAASTTAIGLLQSTAGADSLLLNGTLSKPVNRGLSIDLGSFSSVITFTSANNLGGVTITVNGTFNGVAISETLSGPASNTVATTNNYSTINSITVNGAVTAISIGTGTTGVTDWFTFDNHASVANLAIAAVATATISYSFQVTLDEVQTNTSPTVFTPIVALTAASTTLLANYTAPFKYARFIIISSSGSGALRATILQQGLHS